MTLHSELGGLREARAFLLENLAEVMTLCLSEPDLNLDLETQLTASLVIARLRQRVVALRQANMFSALTVIGAAS